MALRFSVQAVAGAAPASGLLCADAGFCVQTLAR